MTVRIMILLFKGKDTLFLNTIAQNHIFSLAFCEGFRVKRGMTSLLKARSAIVIIAVCDSARFVK